MRGLNTTRPAGNSATATAPVTPADSKFLLILFLPYNKLSIWYVGSRTSEPSKANLCNRRSAVGQSKVVKYLKFGRMLRVRVLPSPQILTVSTTTISSPYLAGNATVSINQSLGYKLRKKCMDVCFTLCL